MKIKIATLTATVQGILRSQGHNDSDVTIIADVLMYAQLRDNNQGVVKLIGKSLEKDPQAKPSEIVTDTKLSARINGNKSIGMVVLNKATEIAIEKAQTHGFGIVGTFNTHSSSGAIGYFAQKIAQQKLIGFVFAGSPETVAPFGSFQPLFGTNPQAIGIPTQSDPLVLDMATSAMAYYGLIEASVAGEKIPEGIAYDKDGTLTTDPNLAMDGALLPFDKNYKGSGLSLIIEILTGPLVGAGYAGSKDNESNWGNLVFAIDPQLLGDISNFTKKVSQLIETVKNAKKLPNVSEIFVPGEKGTKLAKKRLNDGEIEIEDKLYEALVKASGK